MADYTQPDMVEQRVRFFDGQFLQDQDFVDEQKYHLDRERRLGRVLRMSGIADGLSVSMSKANQVTITPGTAIDSMGRQIVLASARTVDLPADRFNDKSAINVYIIFQETAVDLATTGSKSERRWLERPQIVAVAPDKQSTEPWDDQQPTVLLAQLQLDNKGNITVNSGVADYSGLRLPGSVGIGTTAPGAKLEVALGSGLAVKVEPASGSSVYIGRNEDNSVQFDFGNGQAFNSTASLSFNIDTNNDDQARYIDFRTNGRGFAGGASLVRILEGGGVGIGTTDPGSYKLSVNGTTRLGGSTDYQATTVVSVAPGTVQFDAPNVPGGRLAINGSTGNVGIGTNDPGSNRLKVQGGSTYLDGALTVGGTTTLRDVMYGVANDYQKAQFTLSGGGTVTWGGQGDRLKWTARFIAISMARGPSFSAGHFNINQPTSAIPAANVYDGSARAADGTGVLLNAWEALYVVHTVGGSEAAATTFQIRRYTNDFDAPSNWILVGIVNGDDNTIKLGTGVILSARSSSSYGSPLPRGTILMWSGATNALPDGWALCNGQGGTPNLVDRFVVAAGRSYAVNATGGAGTHTHDVDFGTVQTSGVGGGASIYGGGAVHFDFVSSHSHSVGIGARTSTSTANLPPYYALAYIMKL